ncbi:MAG TPA: ABC transporter substrate-binding protein [Dehalococcoidia bacterium]
MRTRLARYPITVAGLAMLLLAFAACGGDDNNTDETPTTAAATFGTGGGTPQAGVTPSDIATTYPITITDMLYRQVTLDKAPVKIAAISPTTVEYVYAVGGTSVTRSSSVDYPEDAVSAMDVGSAYQPNLELIAAQEPDLIIADSVLQPQLQESLEALGVPVLYVGANTFIDVVNGLGIVGQAIDHPTAASKAQNALETQIMGLSRQVPETMPKVLVLNGTPDDFYAAKPESYVGDLVNLIAGDNVARGQPDVGRFPGYTKLSLEQIVVAQPDVVLAITAGPPGGKTISDELSSNPAWKDVPAVKNGRVSEISAELFLQAPGPRAGEALDMLAKLLYPETFS